MLRGIHKATSTWVGKSIMALVMGVLVISFAIWGIGDIFRGFGANSAAKVGGTEISLEQFRQFYSDRLQQISRQAKRPITPDQARAMGLDRQLLGQLVAETTLDEDAASLGLALSDAEIAKGITNDPNFKGLSGQFDRNRFADVIRQAGYSEGRYVTEQRRVLLRRQIAQSVGGNLTVPAAALTAINQYQNEKRSIDYVVLTAAQAGDVAAPGADDLAKYFEARKVLFRAPEYRKVTLLTLSPAALAQPGAIPDADAKSFFDQHKDAFGTPERRELKQIMFPNEQDAAAAKQKLDKGMSFADLAKERGLAPADTDLGLVMQSGIIDPAIAAAAFALKTDEVSAPVKGQFGTVLLQAGKIEPGSQKTFDEAAGQIKKDMAETRARVQISGIRDKLEDERAAGATLSEAAKKLNLQAVTIDAVDRSGRSPDGKPVAAIAQPPELANAVFTTDIGVDSEPLQLPGGGYIWYDVASIAPAHERSLDEVKSQVAERWRDDEIAKRLKTKADEMLVKLKAGGKLAQLAEEANVPVQTANDLQRRKPSGFLPPRLIDEVFKTPKGDAASIDGNNASERYIFQVTNVTDPPVDLTAPEMKPVKDSLQNSYADDIIGQYIAKLENDFGVTLNQTAIAQVVGSSTP
jgi:peptidyl-prolyl cis-trans isomerase D